MTADRAVQLQNAWAEHLRQPVMVKNSLDMEMVLIPPGVFGVSATYHVSLTRPYRIATLEVTSGQFHTFCVATQYRTDAERDRKMPTSFVTHRPLRDFPHPKGARYTRLTPGWGPYVDDQPITYLTWTDAERFLTWLSHTEGRRYRLPTQAEWMWACRAGTATRSYWGDDIQEIGKYAWTRLSGTDRPEHVGQLAPNAWGLYDMLGNVAEMVQDFDSNPQPAGYSTDPTGPPSGTRRIACGGHYMSAVDFSLPNIPASSSEPGIVTSLIGFRVVMEP